ncbi:serine/threonine-protein kinase [Mycolicibacterium sp. XJ870]
MTGHELLVGRYELRRVLGYGGMAEVRDGWDHRLDRAVAVKLMHRAVAAQPDTRRRFESEARAAAKLSHPNIVAVHDFGEHEGTPFIVMERLPGQTLADVIAEGPLPQERVRPVLNDVLAALAAAHAAGVLHRDIKPGNILLTPSRSMKVADFGIAKTAGDVQTMAGQVLGTMAYMSPERIAGAPASVSDDLYAVGVMGYEALLGGRAFPQETPGALARAIMDAPPPPLSAVRPDVDPVLAGVIDRAMARDPVHRFGSAEDMRSALAGYPIPAVVGPAVLGGPPRPATKVFTHSAIAPAATYFVPSAPRHRLAGPTRKFLLAAAIVVAFTVAVLAVAMDPSSKTQVPDPVSTSTSVPTPTTTAPPVVPVVEEPEEKKDKEKKDEKKKDKEEDEGRGNGNEGNRGHGQGNGKGDKDKRE